jgi:hypothetical protein
MHGEELLCATALAVERATRQAVERGLELG